jgi:hypothetical protein
VRDTGRLVHDPAVRRGALVGRDLGVAGHARAIVARTVADEHDGHLHV